MAGGVSVGTDKGYFHIARKTLNGFDFHIESGPVLKICEWGIIVGKYWLGWLTNSP